MQTSKSFPNDLILILIVDVLIQDIFMYIRIPSYLDYQFKM